MISDRWHADLPFRGTRTYVHSTSICNHLRDRFPSANRFELVLREWMANRVIFQPVEAGGSAKATLRIDMPDGGQQRFSLTDDTEFPVTTREPFDEDAIVSRASFHDRTIDCTGVREGTFFDRLISANKALINRSLDPKVRLIASKVVMSGFPTDDRDFSLVLDSHLGTRIFRSSILMDGEKVGELVFYGQ